MGKPGFEYREDYILEKTSWYFWIIRSQSQVTKKLVPSSKTPQKRKHFDCDLGELNLVVAVTCDTACRDESKKFAYSGIFSLSKFWCEGKINYLICQWIPTSFKFSAETKMEDNKPLVTENWEFHYREETLYVAFFGPSDCEYSNAKNKIDNFSKKNFSRTGKVLIDTLNEKLTPVVMGDKWWWVWKSRKTIWKRLFLKLRTVKTLMQHRQIDKSPIQKDSRTKQFWMPTLIEEIKTVVSVKYEVENREKKLKSFVWNFRNTKLLLQRRKTLIFCWKPVYMRYVFDWDLDVGNETCSRWELEVWISIDMNINSTPWDVWTVANLLHGSEQKI